MRRIVQIAATTTELYAVADDGTLWAISVAQNEQWQKVAPLPAKPEVDDFEEATKVATRGLFSPGPP